MCEFLNDRDYVNNEEEICLMDRDIHFTGMNIKYTDYMILIVGDDFYNIDVYVNGNFSGRFHRRSLFTEIIIKIFDNTNFKILFYLIDGYENEYDQLVKFKIYSNKDYFMNEVLCTDIVENMENSDYNSSFMYENEKIEIYIKKVERG